jgi:hypothetical protein
LSYPIGEPFADHSLDRSLGALLIVDAELLDAMVMPEIEFRQIPVEVLDIDTLAGTDKAAL